MANILVADDNIMQLIIIERILKKSGHLIYKAANGYDVIDILKTNDVDVFITDIFMPEVGGLELIMKARELNKSIGIIAMSSGGDLIKDNRYLDYVKQLGADFSFAKPVEKNNLRDAIEYLVEQ